MSEQPPQNEALPFADGESAQDQQEAAAPGIPASIDAARHAPARESSPVAAPSRRARGSTLATRFLSSLWLGSAAFLLAVAAPAAFRASDSPANAANVVGAMLTRWHYIGLLLPLLLVVLEWKRARTTIITFLFAGILFAAAQAAIDLKIRRIRAESSVPISELSPTHPVRRQFGALHGVSSLLLVAQFAAACGVVFFDPE